MPTVYALLPDAKPHFLDSAGDPLSGGKLFIYTAGSSTKATTYTESDGVTPNANPLVLNSRGETGSGVYAATGSYKLVLAPANDTDPPASAIWTRDDVTPINDVANATATEWSSTGLTPTYIGATSFSLVGDQTTDHHVGRRVKTANSGGTVYGYISASVYTSLTTVTVVNDSGVLDAGLSDVQLGFLRNDTPSIPSRGVVTLGGEIATTSGTSAATGAVIYSWAKLITLQFEDVSTNGTAGLMLQLSDSGGFETSGYKATAADVANAAQATATQTTGFPLTAVSTAAGDYSGIVTLRLKDAANNTWVYTSALNNSAGAIVSTAAGVKSLSGVLTNIQLTTVGVSDTFDGGSFSWQQQ